MKIFQAGVIIFLAYISTECNILLVRWLFERQIAENLRGSGEVDAVLMREVSGAKSKRWSLTTEAAKQS